MARRLQLQSLLQALTDPALPVYFEPPTSDKMSYPCITYERDFEKTSHADNQPYARRKRYLVTVIDRDPDSLIPDMVADLPSSSFNRGFKTEGLNHSIYTLFY
jgi:hypothetical protein